MKFKSLLIVVSLVVVMQLVVTLPADARLTSVAKDFANRTKIFSATRIMAPPTANGSYLMSMFLNQPAASEGTVVATLRWTDEQGPQSRSLALAGNHLPQGTAFPIRVVAHTPVTVETSGTVGTSYDVFIRGVGFWIPGTEPRRFPTTRKICCSGRTPRIPASKMC